MSTFALTDYVKSWGQYWIAQAALFANQISLRGNAAEAAGFLMDPFKKVPLYPSEKTIVCGEREVCGAINRVFAERAFYNPGLYGQDVIFVGNIHPWTGYFAPKLIPQQTKAGIIEPTPNEIESDYSCRVFEDEYNKLCLQEGVDYRCRDRFNLMTASSLGLVDTGRNASENMKLASSLGAFNSRNLAVVSLPYAMYRNIGTLFKTWTDMNLGELPCVSPHLIYPHAIGITQDNWFKELFVCHLVVDEWKKSRKGGAYTKHFMRYDPEKLNRRNKACGSPYPKLTFPTAGK